MSNNWSQLFATISIPATAAAVLAVIYSFLPAPNLSTATNSESQLPNGSVSTSPAQGDPLLPVHQGLVAFKTRASDDPFRRLADAKKAFETDRCDRKEATPDVTVHRSHCWRGV